MPATTLTDRAVIRLSGEDVRGFLQGLVTSDVAGPLPVWAGLLTPQGKACSTSSSGRDGDDLLLDCEAEAADELIKRLALYRLRRPIAIERDDCARRALVAATATAASPDPRLAALGRRWLAPAGEPARGWLAHRLRLGVTEGRAELGDMLWLECNAAELNGVSFTKGCYVGQENTARMNWRQKVNRRLVVVEARRAGARTRIDYPELGLAVDHRRVDDLAGNAIIPDWLQAVDQPQASADREGPHARDLRRHRGEAESRSSGSWPSPVICSQIGIPAPSSMRVHRPRADMHIVDIVAVDADQRRAMLEPANRAAAAVRKGWSPK